MKQLFLSITVISMMSISAYAMYGVLTGQENTGMNTICYYSNGTAIIVGPGEVCPVSVD
jgi:hypothetical protein